MLRRVPATASGYAELQQWAQQLADVGELMFGIEGAGSWGAGLCQQLQHAGHRVVEVQRPSTRPTSRKSDRIDALAAAKSVLTDERISTPRRRGILTAIRALLIARRSAVAERTRVLNQLQALNAAAPVLLRERVGDGTGKQLKRRILSMRGRPHAAIDERVAFAVMRDLATRSRALGADTKRYRHQLADLINTLDKPCSTKLASNRSPPPSSSPAIPAASRTRAHSRPATEPHPPPPQVKPFATA